MADQSTLDKLRLLLPHWLEHNRNHQLEFARWAEAALAAGRPEIAALIKQAMAGMQETDAALEEAVARMGGPAASCHHHHHHDE